MRIITSEQTKTLHPWLVPVSSFAATHASMFVLFCLFCCFSSCYCALFFFLYLLICLFFKSFGPFPYVIHVQIESFLCFTLHAWLTTNATFITQNELIFKALPTTGPQKERQFSISCFRFCIIFDRRGEVIGMGFVFLHFYSLFLCVGQRS